jgi:type III restriction enzyme
VTADRPQVVIENPILNSPFEEPRRHFEFDDDGITDTVAESRRPSSYFVPIAKPKVKGKQLVLDTEWTRDRIEENPLINQIRARVAFWRQGNYQGVTQMTRNLIEYWCGTDRDRRLFFCQIEALETVIYITEVATKANDAWIENLLREANDGANSGLHRMAVKMATGSGKTVVMAMLIAWQALNKISNKQDRRFSDAFLIVAPGITIRDRLRVLLPNDPNNFYRVMDLVPPDLRSQLNQASIIITNFHLFKLRERGDASKLTKQILTAGEKVNEFTESPDEMVRRVCRELGSRKNIVVINDEAHHCYRRRPEDETLKLVGEEKKEADQREEEARVWISGLEAVAKKIDIKRVFDLSATPFFLRGSGYPEGTLFPWVISDFSLIDAIESGIVKVPRVPVSDNSMTGDQPTFRNLWMRIKADLPKKSKKDANIGGEPQLPVELEAALQVLYFNYEKCFQLWEGIDAARNAGLTPPVFIVVCNNTAVSKLVYDWIAGWEKALSDEQMLLIPGKLGIFSNVIDGLWSARPNTILIDSAQLESGEGMSQEFKQIASREIDEFKAEYRTRFPGRDAEELTDEDLLREVMNTVGKPGKLGEGVKCVVSVSMLTEGWDANTVTHILGVRAFSTQLLCEQVVGRGLRRISYTLNDSGLFDPEYAEVYGVPFSFIPCAGATKEPKLGPIPVRVRALSDRVASEISFPRLVGYRYDLGIEKLSAEFTEASRFVLSTAHVPTSVENAPIVGETSVHTLDELKQRRVQEVAFLLAKLVLEKYFRDEAGADKPWLFPQLLQITRQWIDKCVVCKDNTFPQLLLLIEFAKDAADRIYRSVAASHRGKKTLKPILRPYDTVGSTQYVDFDTTKPVYVTDPAKCHVSHVVTDSSWENKMAQTLESMPEVHAYVKNQGLNFAIPYTLNGKEHNYIPDFIVRFDDGRGAEDLLNLLVEVSGEKRKDKEAKAETTRTLWVPAVNNHGAYGRWSYVEVSDPWAAEDLIRSTVRAL